MRKILLLWVVLFGFITIAGCSNGGEKASFVVEVINVDGDVLLNQIIPLDSSTSKDPVALIDEAIGLDYTVFSIGTFVNGIGGNYPTEYGVTYNYYFSLFVNGVSSTVGLDQVVIQNGTKISFIEVTLLDETDLLVDRLITQFIEAHADTYLTDTALDIHVASAIHQLHVKGYDVPAISNWIENPAALLQRNNPSNAMKTAIIEKILGLDTATTTSALEGFNPAHVYEALSLLTGLTAVLGSDSRIQVMISQITSGTPEFMDSDFAGMALLSLAPYHLVAQVDAAKDDYVNFISENLTATGVTAWGNANASSTASVILGLVAFGIDPRGENFQTQGVDLIEALLLYRHEGAFKWTLDATSADMLFSTPQAFAALVAYKLYRDVYGNPSFNLFDFS